LFEKFNTGPKKTIRYSGSFLLALICCVFVLVSCGKDKPKIDPSSYDGWQNHSYGHFNFHFSPDSRWLKDKEELAEGYERFLKGLCEVLEMPIPDGMIDLYVYTPGMEAYEITGRDAPFSTENEIHWSGRTPYGYQLTKFLLGKKGIRPGRFNVLNEGVPHLLDFSGINYHDKLNRINNSGMFIGVLELGGNARFDSLDYHVLRSESASLCGYIVYNYGIDRLFMLWKSSIGWERSIETIFQLPVDEFENGWLDFARSQTENPDGTVEDDTTRTMRLIVE
jgi:hypothetical protein